MNNHEKVQACNKSWSAASRNHKEVLNLTPKLKLAEGLYNHPVSVKGVLYPVVILTEGSMLSLQLYSEIQILLQGAPGFVHVIATVALAVLLSLFLHVLVLTILPLTRSDLYLYYLA